MDIILDPFDTSCMMLVSTEFSVSVASPRLFCISGSLCMSRMKWFSTKLSTLLVNLSRNLPLNVSYNYIYLGIGMMYA